MIHLNCRSSVIYAVVLMFCFLCLTQAQVAPQIMYSKPHDEVIVGKPDPYLFDLRGAKLSNSADEPIVASNRKFYQPPRELSIRELIARKNGMDPTDTKTSYTLAPSSERLNYKEIYGDQLTTNSPVPMRSLPSIAELAGLSGQNSVYPPRGMGTDPIGLHTVDMPSGPMPYGSAGAPNVDPITYNPSLPRKPVSLHVPSPVAPKVDLHPKPNPAADPSDKVIENPKQSNELDVILGPIHDVNLPKEKEIKPEDKVTDESIASLVGDITTSSDIATSMSDELNDNSNRNSGAGFFRYANNFNVDDEILPPSLLEVSEQYYKPAVVQMVKSLPKEVSDEIDRILSRRGTQVTEKTVQESDENKPIMVRKIGGLPIDVLEKQEKEAKAKAAEEKLKAETKAKEEAEAKLKAEKLAKKKAKEAKKAALLAAQEEAIINEEGEKLAKKAIEEAESYDESLLEVDVMNQLSDQLAEDVAIQHDSMILRAVHKMQDKIKAQNEKQKQERAIINSKPWWENPQGVKENNERKLKQLGIKVAKKEDNILPRFKEINNGYAQLQDNAQNVGYLPSLLESNSLSVNDGLSAAPNSAEPVSNRMPPMYHTYGPNHGVNVLKVKPLANPYAYSTMDLLYPQVRGVNGVSGIADGRTLEQVAQQNKSPTNNQSSPRNNVIDNSNVPKSNGNGNTIVINVSAAPPAPTRPVTTTTTTTSVPSRAPQFFPPNPFFGYNAVVSTPSIIGPTGGTVLSDNNSFGSLRV